MSKSNQSKVNVTLGENPIFDAHASRSLEVIKSLSTRLVIAPNASLKFHLNVAEKERPLPLIVEVSRSVTGDNILRVCLDNEDIVEVIQSTQRTHSTPVSFYRSSILLKKVKGDKELHQVHDRPETLKASPTYVIYPISGTSAAMTANQHFLETMFGNNLFTEYYDHQMLSLEYIDKPILAQIGLEADMPVRTSGLFFNSLVYKIIRPACTNDFIFEPVNLRYNSENPDTDYVRFSYSRNLIRFHMRNKDDFIVLLSQLERFSKSKFFINVDHSKYKPHAPLRYTVMPLLGDYELPSAEG